MKKLILVVLALSAPSAFCIEAEQLGNCKTYYSDNEFGNYVNVYSSLKSTHPELTTNLEGALAGIEGFSDEDCLRAKFVFYNLVKDLGPQNGFTVLPNTSQNPDKH